jgi:hypothetical protein
LPLVADLLCGNALAAPAFHSNNLVIKRAQVQTEVSPCLEVVLDSDSATLTRGISDREILVESRCADNRPVLIDYTRILIDYVLRFIARNRPLYSAKARRIKGILNNIVFNKGVFAPAIDRKKGSSATNSKST